MTLDLFASLAVDAPTRVQLAEGAVLLRRFAVAQERAVLDAIESVAKQAPFRHMVTPGGFRMSVAMTNCGDYGWTSSPEGYLYAARDPETGEAWPAIPSVFFELAQRAAEDAGYPAFQPDACLINRYDIGARLTLHQDKNELDLSAPIVSFSFGIPAVFLFGGLTRSAATQRIRLEHGDVAVWGGPSRLRYHGVEDLEANSHALTGPHRFNLTFRKTR